MRRFHLLAAVALLAAGCGASPVTPQQAQIPATLVPAEGLGGQITFNGFAVNREAAATYKENGYTVTATAGSWMAVTTYGAPKPSMQFTADQGTTVEGRIEVTGGGATFTFTSVDLYASVIPIPYTITAMRGTAVVFTMTDKVPNTFGAFRTVSNPQPAAVIDKLIIQLTNASPACCGNPMGVDNLMFGQ
jgi:hypothetical protein